MILKIGYNVNRIFYFYRWKKKRMEYFDTVILGSGYASVGYAAAHQSTLIVEEQEIADTHFYLPLRSFRYAPHIPKTNEGKALEGIFRSLGLFGEERQNTNGFECALCRYLDEHPLPILLKSRIVDRAKRDGMSLLTLATNEGLLSVACRSVIDTRSMGARTLTVMILANTQEDARRAAQKTDGMLEGGFYPEQYALHIPDTGLDENAVKLAVHDMLSDIAGVRLLAIAPIYASAGSGAPLSDDDFDNPIAAFEAGYLLGRESAL